MKHHTIVTGQGVGPCCAGAHYETAIQVFGRPKITLADDFEYYRDNPGAWPKFKRLFKRWTMAQRLLLRRYFGSPVEAPSSTPSADAKPDANTIINGKPSSNYLCYYAQGVSLSYSEQGEILSLFFYFRKNEHRPYRIKEYRAFRGATDLGIGAASTFADVERLHGSPTSTSELYQSISYHYDALGMTYVFNDKGLETIIVQKPKTTWWPEEWPHRAYTHDMDWMCFKPSGLTGTTNEAQASFNEFARTVEQDRLQPTSAYQAAVIQVFLQRLPHNPVVGEFAFLDFVSADGKSVTGTSFRTPGDPTPPQSITLPIERVCDWFLVPQAPRQGFGAFSMQFHLAEAMESEQQQLRQAPPYSWFAHRDERAAHKELFAIPPCKQCRQRYLGIEQEQKNGVCKICRDDGKRCTCPDCDAPLIRYPHQPALCRECV